MEITIYISKNVFWFAAGIVASVVVKFLWHKFIVPGYIYLVKKIDERGSRYERIPKKSVFDFDKEENIEEGFFESPMIDPDEQDKCLSRMKKRMKK